MREKLSVRSIVLALVLVVVWAWIDPYVEIVLSATQLGSFSPPGVALVTLIIFALAINPLLRIIPRRLGMRPFSLQELATSYVMLLAAAPVLSCQFAQWVVPVTTGPFYYQSLSNHYGEYLQLIPKWWGPRDPEVIRRFYEGAPAFAIQWSQWIKPLLSIGSMVFLLYFVFQCLAVLFEEQWIRRERLSFPLVQLPLALIEEPEKGLWAPMLRNKLLWIGAAVPGVVHLLNGLHTYFPAVPQIPLLMIDLAHNFTDRPWSSIGQFFICIYFCVIGYAFLLPFDIAVSMWVFFFLFKLECVFGAWTGWSFAGDSRGLRDAQFPYIVAQMTGSLMMLVGIMFFTARHHFAELWQKVIGRVKMAPGDPPYRLAVLGSVLGLLALGGWMALSGMPFWLGLVFFILTLIYMLATHRMMAEGGTNFLWAAQSAPNYILFSLDGGGSFSKQTWQIIFSMPYFTWNFKGAVGPHAFEAFKIIEQKSLPRRGLTVLSLVGIIIGMVAAYWAMIYLVHTQGGGAALDGYRYVHVGQRPFDELISVVSFPQSFSPQKFFAIFIGMGMMLFLTIMRWRFLWWHLHPIGYAASTAWGINYMWFSMLVGSLLNYLLTKYGGLKLYRQARPFFLGLILGDFIMMLLWLVVDSITGVRGYRLFG